MTSAQRILVAALAVLAATSTTAAIWLATRPPPPPMKVKTDEPYLPVSSGAPNAVGELVAARGGPVVPKLQPTENTPRMRLADFQVSVPADSLAAAAGCVEAVGAWLLANPAGGSAMATTEVSAACAGEGQPLVGRVRLSTRPAPSKKGMALSCEASVAYTWTGPAGEVQKPTLRGHASGAEEQEACRAAIASMVATFRARAAGG